MIAIPQLVSARKCSLAMDVACRDLRHILLRCCRQCDMLYSPVASILQQLTEADYQDEQHDGCTQCLAA